MTVDNKGRKKSIEILVPCFNEEHNVSILIAEIDKVIPHDRYRHEFIFIDDGSTDNTYEEINKFAQERNDIRAIKLARNFGKEAVFAIGLKKSRADAIITIDGDLQQPPHLIPTMLFEWENGALIVDGVKERKQDGGVLKKGLRSLFNMLFGRLTNMDFGGASDYKLLDRKAVEIMNQIEEKNRFYRGLTNWIGLKHSKVEYRVEQRQYGKTKWNWFRLFQLSIDAITAYSAKPLQIVTVLGIVVFLFSIVLGAQTLYNKWFENAVSGFATVILVILIMSSIIMLSIGVIGIYISRIFDEVKNRPIFIIEDEVEGRSERENER